MNIGLYGEDFVRARGVAPSLSHQSLAFDTSIEVWSCSTQYIRGKQSNYTDGGYSRKHLPLMITTELCNTCKAAGIKRHGNYFLQTHTGIL